MYVGVGLPLAALTTVVYPCYQLLRCMESPYHCNDSIPYGSGRLFLTNYNIAHYL